MARSLPVRFAVRCQHDGGQPADGRGGEQEPDDVAGGGAGEDAQPAAAAAEDRQAREAQEQVQADGGEGPARAQGQPREHDGKGLQRDGHAEPAHGNGGDQCRSGHQGGEDGDEAKVGGIPADPAARGPGCGGTVGLRHDVPVGVLLRDVGTSDIDCTVAAGRLFCRRPTNRRPGCWRAPPMHASRPGRIVPAACLLPYEPMSGRRGGAGRLVEAVLSHRPAPAPPRLHPLCRGIPCCERP